MCRGYLKGKRDGMEIGAWNVLNRCYSYKWGTAPESLRICKEFYNPDATIKKISCDGGRITFIPNELFLIAPDESSKDVRIKNFYKLPFGIAWGACSTM